jgi:signal transduction histidine kinase
MWNGAVREIVLCLLLGALIVLFSRRSSKVRALDAELRARQERINILEKELDAARSERAAALGRFRHDLIGPLGELSGFLDLLQEGAGGDLHPLQEVYLESMRESLTKVLSVVKPSSSQQYGLSPLVRTWRAQRQEGNGRKE